MKKLRLLGAACGCFLLYGFPSITNAIPPHVTTFNGIADRGDGAYVSGSTPEESGYTMEISDTGGVNFVDNNFRNFSGVIESDDILESDSNLDSSFTITKVDGVVSDLPGAEMGGLGQAGSDDGSIVLTRIFDAGGNATQTNLEVESGLTANPFTWLSGQSGLFGTSDDGQYPAMDNITDESPYLLLLGTGILGLLVFLGMPRHR